MQITPVQNGAHSLAMALEAIDRALSNTGDEFAIKDAILRSHHALETLLKAALFDHNPVLLLDADAKVGKFVDHYAEFFAGKNQFLIDEARTIGVGECLRRLRSLRLLGDLSEREFSELTAGTDLLGAVRNAIQHFAVEVNPDRVLRVLGGLLPRFLDTIELLSRGPDRFRGVGYRLFMMHSGVDLGSVRREVARIYPRADHVLSTLRSEYDDLVRQAIEALKTEPFEGVQGRLVLRDYGEVGAPPYMPEVDASGILSFQIDRSRIHRLEWEGPAGLVEQADEDLQVIRFAGSVKIGDPSLEDMDADGQLAIGIGTIAAQVELEVRSLDGVLMIPGLAEHVSLLRDAIISLDATLDYRAVCLATEVHFSVQEVLEATGECRVHIRAFPKGYGEEEAQHAIDGILACPLTEETAPFRLNAFRDPDGKLRSSNRSLEWTIGLRGSLQFS